MSTNAFKLDLNTKFDICQEVMDTLWNFYILYNYIFHHFIPSACERSYTQTCKDCEAYSECSSMVQHSAFSRVDCDNLCNSTDSCFMAVFKPLDDACYLYECTTLQYSFGNTAFRRACSDGESSQTMMFLQIFILK